MNMSKSQNLSNSKLLLGNFYNFFRLFSITISVWKDVADVEERIGFPSSRCSGKDDRD